MKIRTLSVLAFVLLGASQMALAQTKIGYVDSEKMMREAAPAKAAQQRIEKEFTPRNKALETMGKNLEALQKELENPNLSTSVRQAKEREFNELRRKFQSDQIAFREDLSVRQNEELASVLKAASSVIEKIAKSENFDLIVQEAVYKSPKIDLTDRVIKELSAAK